MAYEIGQLLEQSCDAIAVSRLGDGLLLEVNEAFHTVTGYRRADLVRRTGLELFVLLDPEGTATFARRLREHGSIGPIRAGLRTRSGELHIGSLSAVVFSIDGEDHVLAAVRDCKVPNRAERRLAAQAELHRIVRDRGGSPEAGTLALRALGECLQWDLGNLWEVAHDGRLRCAATWRSPLSGLEELEELSTRMTLGPGQGLAGRVLADGGAAWVPSVVEEEAFVLAVPAAGEQVLGWFAFPARVGGRVAGVVELYSRETRQPDPDLLDLLDGFGRQFGALLRAGELPGGGPAGGVGAAAASPGQAGAAVTPFPGQQRSETDPSRPVAVVRRRVQPTPRFTLKALSERTGVPAATLRTWERRYRIISPVRTTSGYRLFTDQDTARILEVKGLVDAGVRISEAAAAVAEADRTPPGAAPRSSQA
jgi:PAS domain S-box-containing protein